MRLPISQEVTILLSGRLEDTELLSKSPLKLVNLVVQSPSPRSRGLQDSISRTESAGISLSALLTGLGSPVVLQATSAGQVPRCPEGRLLTPSKYRAPSGRDCGTQTDCEGELSSVSSYRLFA